MYVELPHLCAIRDVVHRSGELMKETGFSGLAEIHSVRKEIDSLC